MFFVDENYVNISYPCAFPPKLSAAFDWFILPEKLRFDAWDSAQTRCEMLIIVF